MKRNVITAVSALCVSFLAILACRFDKETPVYADGENRVTLQSNQEVTKGNTYYGYAYIESLENIASLNVSIHYDSDAVTISNTYNQVFCSLYDSSNRNETLNYSYIFNAGGPAYRTSLFYFTYRVSDETNLTSSYFDIVIDDAYDFNLNSVNVSGSRLYFNINEKQTPTQYCYVYGTSSIVTKIEEEFEITYRLSTYQVATGTVEIQYDRELFEFVSIQQLGFLTNKMVDVNSFIDGSVILSFLSTEYSYNTDFLKLTLKTIGNVNSLSTIKLIASNFYDLNLTGFVCNGCSTTVNLSYDSNYDDTLPKAFLTSTYDSANNKVTLLAKLSADSQLGAGDFIISWNKDYLTYNSSTKKFTPSFFNVNDKFAADGQLKFSIISLTNIVTPTDIIEVVFDVNNSHDDTSTQLFITGSGLSDSLTEPIYLNFVNCSQTIPGRHTFGEWSTTKEPTCTEVGSEHRTCSVCGHEETREIAATGHTWEEDWTIDVEATCEHEGSKSHHCANCDAKKDETVIEKTAHQPADSVRENEVAATCTEGGSYDEVVYCKDCHTEISREHKTTEATGHTYGEWSTTKEPTCIEVGSEHRTCSVCGHEETREIPPTNSCSSEPTEPETPKEKSGCSGSIVATSSILSLISFAAISLLFVKRKTMK